MASATSYSFNKRKKVVKVLGSLWLDGKGRWGLRARDKSAWVWGQGTGGGERIEWPEARDG